MPSLSKTCVQIMKLGKNNILRFSKFSHPIQKTKAENSSYCKAFKNEKSAFRKKCSKSGSHPRMILLKIRANVRNYFFFDPSFSVTTPSIKLYP